MYYSKNKGGLRKNNTNGGNQNYYNNPSQNKLYDYNNYQNNYQLYAPPMFINPLTNSFSFQIFASNPYERNFNFNQTKNISTGFYPLMNGNKSNYSGSNSLEGFQETSASFLSTSEGNNDPTYGHYYDNFGEDYFESLKKGLTDITNLYNSQKDYRPKASLLCNYYCNIEKTTEDEAYLTLQIQRLAEKISKITKINRNDTSDNNSNSNTNSNSNNNDNIINEINKKKAEDINNDSEGKS